VRPLHKFGGSLDHIKDEEIAGWSVPITYVIGEDTLPALEKCHERFTSAAPQTRTVKVSGACHLIPWQQPGAVVEAVRSATPT
jgi:pimeloyl-ACP methyl ester carboxylesterase